jgi:microcystin-dependent protein
MSNVFSNNGRTLLTSTITNVATTIPVSSTSTFPTITVSDFFMITITDGTNLEIVKVTGTTSNTFTGCVRGQEGTTANSFISTTPVEHRLTAGALGNMVQKTGSTMTGPLVLAANAVNPLESVPKQQLDVVSAVANAALPKAGGTMTGSLILANNASNALESVPFQQLVATFYNVVPVGTILDFLGTTPPTSYVELNGGLASRTTFSELWSFASSRGLVVSEATWIAGSYTMFSSGDGSTTFRLPDVRGMFSRGWDHGAGRDSGRTLGSYQADALQNITGNLSVSDHGTSGTTDGAFQRSGSGTVERALSDSAADNPAFTFDASRVARTSTETRPMNFAVMKILKAGSTSLPAGPAAYVPSGLTIYPSSATVNMTEGVTYSVTDLTAVTPYSTLAFSISSGSLPTGVTLSISGTNLRIGGMPSVNGTFNSVILLTNSGTSQTGYFNLQVIVAASTPAPPPVDGGSSEDG